MYTSDITTNKLKGNPKTIAFTEGTDPRVLEATSRLLASSFLKSILVGNPTAIEAAAGGVSYNIRGAQTVDPENSDRFDEVVEMFYEIRKSKGVTLEQVKKILSDANYFDAMLIKMGIGDCLLGGATYSTADTIRPASQIIKTKPGNRIVSFRFILVRPSVTSDNELFVMANCAINIEPTEDEPAEIYGEAVNCVKTFGIDPKIAFLSYSTVGSGSGKDVDKIGGVYTKAKAAFSNEAIDSEMQFDVVVSPTVTRTEIKDSEVAGYTNTFIFPDISADNVGYEIAQRLGSLDACGPILLGLNASINDPSRSCNMSEVYPMAAMAAALA